MTDGPVTKDALVGKKVVDSEGRVVGTVKDILLTVGVASATLRVEGEGGEPRDIPWDSVQAVGDFVLLKPEQQVQRTCPTCKGPLTYVPQYQRWYCYKCKKYA